MLEYEEHLMGTITAIPEDRGVISGGILLLQMIRLLDWDSHCQYG
jgi:hypothetical protein